MKHKATQNFLKLLIPEVTLMQNFKIHFAYIKQCDLGVCNALVSQFLGRFGYFLDVLPLISASSLPRPR